MYTRLPGSLASDEGSLDIERSEKLQSYPLLKKGQKHNHFGCLKQLLITVAHAASIIFCIGILSSAHRMYGKSRKDCIEKLNAYSPLLDAIDQDYQEVRFAYSLWHNSPTKGPPSPKVEEAWQDLMKYGTIAITAEDILKIGHNLTAVQFPPSVGGGYPATAMGTHAIHCLHYIWQDHYIGVIPRVQETKIAIPEMYERHYEHCVDYIRQYLMCKFDTTVMPFNWVRDHQNPTPNGNTIHKCVNWDSLQDWLRDRAVQQPEDFKWSQPTDAVRLDENP